MRASKQPKEGERSPDSEVTERGIAPGLEVWEEREWETCQGRTNHLHMPFGLETYVLVRYTHL